jgi:hypothetical protein
MFITTRCHFTKLFLTRQAIALKKKTTSPAQPHPKPFQPQPQPTKGAPRCMKTCNSNVLLYHTIILLLLSLKKRSFLFQNMLLWTICLFMQTCMEDYTKPYKKNIHNTNLTQYNKTIVTAKMMTIKMHIFYKHVAL